MGLMLKALKNGNGSTRWVFYGQYQKDNRRVSVSPKLLGAVRGKPPASGRLSDRGDAAFEESRRIAEGRLADIVRGTDRETAPVEYARKIYNAAYGSKWKNIPIERIVDAYRARDYDGERPGAEYIRHNVAVIQAFVDWMKERNPKARVLDVSPETAQAYRDHLREACDRGRRRTTRSLRAIRAALSMAFSAPGVLPAGAVNPFGKGALEIRSRDGDETIHREPVLGDKMIALVEACKRSQDRETAEMMICGAVTGLRRGDVARLKWSNVEIDEPLPGVKWRGALHVRTSKTGAPVDLPVVPSLRAILERRKNGKPGRGEYVFPEASVLIDGPDHDGKLARDGVEGARPWMLAERFKAIFVDAFASDEQREKAAKKPEEPTKKLEKLEGETLEKVRAALEKQDWTKKRRDRTADFIERYAAGQTFNQIMAETQQSKGLISLYLHAAESASGVRFVRMARTIRRKTEAQQDALIAAVTRAERAGRRAVSVYDFHALRTSFVTALKLGGMRDEEIVKFTGHQYRRKEDREGSIVLEVNYNKIRATDYAAKLETILPRELTGCPERKEPAPSVTAGKPGAFDLSALIAAVRKLSKKDKAALLSALVS